mmetsp:Transcript_95343/g.269372  ORF Transcript_95343/g.269372 Transcript_95343/m.269372 type:complete len:321 (+) Transcript_95343:538-1500(+)
MGRERFSGDGVGHGLCLRRRRPGNIGHRHGSSQGAWNSSAKWWNEEQRGRRRPGLRRWPRVDLPAYLAYVQLSGLLPGRRLHGLPGHARGPVQAQPDDRGAHLGVRNPRQGRQGLHHGCSCSRAKRSRLRGQQLPKQGHYTLLQPQRWGACVARRDGHGREPGGRRGPAGGQREPRGRGRHRPEPGAAVRGAAPDAGVGSQFGCASVLLRLRHLLEPAGERREDPPVCAAPCHLLYLHLACGVRGPLPVHRVGWEAPLVVQHARVAGRTGGARGEHGPGALGLRAAPLLAALVRGRRGHALQAPVQPACAEGGWRSCMFA